MGIDSLRFTWGYSEKLRIESINTIYESADPLNAAALPEAEKERCKAHFDECALCRDMLSNSQDLSVEVRHAGAPYPEKFDLVIQQVLDMMR